MKLNRTKFWISMIILSVGFVYLLINNRDYEMRDLSLIIYLLIYFTLIVLRLKDAWESAAMVFLCFLFPAIVFYFGCLPSEKYFIKNSKGSRRKLAKTKHGLGRKYQRWKKLPSEKPETINSYTLFSHQNYKRYKK